jgi:hypothetical protein
MLPYTPDQIRDAVEQACREQHIESMYIGSVHAFLEEDEDSWPACCGSSCEPCVLTLEAAARRALILLERTQSVP